MKILFIFQGYTASPDKFDNGLWKEILKCDVGDILFKNGKRLFETHKESMHNFFKNFSKTHLSSVVYNKRTLIPLKDYSDNIILYNKNKVKNISNYDVIIIDCTWAYYDYISYLRKKYPDKIIIGIQDESIQEIQFCDTHMKVSIYGGLHSLDCYICYNRQTFSWVKPCVKNTIYLYHPITTELIKRISKKIDKKDKRKIALGISNWNYDFSNVFTNFLIFKKLNESCQNKLYGEMVGIREYRKEEVSLFQSIDNAIEIVGWLSEEYYSRLSTYNFLIQMPTRAVAGRVSAECAILGTPVIGNENCDMQKYCWPDLSVEEFDVKTAVSLGKRLIEDRQFYDRVVWKAKRKIVRLAEETTTYKEKIINITETIKKARRVT